MIASATALRHAAILGIATAVGFSFGFGAWLGSRPSAPEPAPPSSLRERAPDAFDTPADGPASFAEIIVGPAQAIAPPDPLQLQAALQTVAVVGPFGAGHDEALDPAGYPRIAPLSQFDGGPLQSANCTMAAGAMLARLAFGVVTDGSTLRRLQDDQEGGTDLQDLATALARGWGVSVERGLITPSQLRALLSTGHGVVLQGDYGVVPGVFSLQRGFDDGHAVYVDGYWPGAGAVPDAFYVIDPLFRPYSRYEGTWWPGPVVDAFAETFGRDGRYSAAWALVSDGTPPPREGPDLGTLPDVPPLDEVDPRGEPSEPGEEPPRPPPPEVPGSVPEPQPSGEPASPSPTTPGDGSPPPPDVPGDRGPPRLGSIEIAADVSLCAISPPPPGCPGGFIGRLAGAIPGEPSGTGPPVRVEWLEARLVNRALLAFTTSPGAAALVTFWAADGDGTVGSATVATDPGDPARRFASLEVLADTAYRFAIVADEGGRFAPPTAGSFTSGPGLVTFATVPETRSAPAGRPASQAGPYTSVSDGALTPPTDGGTCHVARTAYEVTGIDHTEVVVRAFPEEPGGGAADPTAVLEARGPAGVGEVALGCLRAGSAYRVAVTAIGDDRGPLYEAPIMVGP